MKKNILIFSGSSHPDLARRVAEALDLSLGEVKIDRFPDGEIGIRILENVRGRDVFVVQSIAHYPNRYLMEMLRNDEDIFPDVRSLRVWVDGIELTKTYDSTTIQTNNEFYVVAQVNIVDIVDNVAIYLKDGFDLAGKIVTFLYTTIAKNIIMATKTKAICCIFIWPLEKPAVEFLIFLL